MRYATRRCGYRKYPRTERIGTRGVRSIDRCASHATKLCAIFLLFQTTNSTSFALYYLARNPDLQDKLRREATTLLADPDSPITSEVLGSAAYTKAVIKETFRLNPISVGVGRILQADVVLSGYHVPRGVINQLSLAR